MMVTGVVDCRPRRPVRARVRGATAGGSSGGVQRGIRVLVARRQWRDGHSDSVDAATSASRGVDQTF